MIKFNFLENSEDQSDCQEKLNWPLNSEVNKETVINEISFMFNQSENTRDVFYFLNATGA